MRSLIIIFIFVLTTGVHCPAQHLVTVTTHDAAVYEGKKNKVVIWVDVQEGYHIQAHRVNDASLIPTTIEVKTEEKVVINRAKFPAPKKFRLEGTSTYLKVYDGRFPIALSISPGAGAQPGKHVLPATLQYQACNSQSCLFPRVVDFSIPVEIRR